MMRGQVTATSSFSISPTKFQTAAEREKEQKDLLDKGFKTYELLKTRFGQGENVRTGIGAANTPVIEADQRTVIATDFERARLYHNKDIEFL